MMSLGAVESLANGLAEREADAITDSKEPAAPLRAQPPTANGQPQVRVSPQAHIRARTATPATPLVPIRPTPLTPFMVPGRVLEPSTLEAKVTNWLLQRMPQSTTKTYSPYVKEFHGWCSSQQVTAFPASPATVAGFLIHLNDDRGLKVNTIKVASAAVASQYKFAGIASPTTDPMVKMTRKVIGEVGVPPRQKLPMTVDMAGAIAARHFSSRKFIDLRNTFMIILAMAGFFREDELVALGKDDVWLDTVCTEGSPTTPALFVYVEKSKTSRDRVGYTVIIPAGSQPLVCPHTWFRKYTAARLPRSPFFFHHDNSLEGLSTNTPNHIVHNELAAIGIDPSEYGSHSCRSGGVTEAADKGVAKHLLQRHGNWKSDAILNYMRDSWERQMLVKVF